MDLQLDEKSGLWFRPDRLDLRVIKEQRAYKPLGFQPEDILLDLGAHIGSTAKLALHQVDKIICVEPDPENFELLCHNLSGEPSVTRLKAAVVANSWHSAFIRLYLNSGKGADGHSLIHRRGRDLCEVVRAFRFCELLDMFQPTLIKMDIEGYEYELIEELANLPPSVRAIAIELHVGRKQWLEEKVPQLRKAIQRNYREHKPYKVDKARFGTVIIWHRK